MLTGNKTYTPPRSVVIGNAADPENATSVQGSALGYGLSASVTIAETPGRTMVRPGFRRGDVRGQRC